MCVPLIEQSDWLGSYMYAIMVYVCKNGESAIVGSCSGQDIGLSDDRISNEINTVI